MELSGFRSGSRAEYLARFALSRVGFIAPVPREEDRFGIDLFLHLCKEERKKGKRAHVPKGPTVAFQIKNNKRDDPLKGDKLKSFFACQTPLFYAYVDARGDRIEIFHPYLRIGHSHFSQVTELTLKFGTPLKEEKNDLSFSNHHHHHYLYGPIFSANISDLDNKKSEVTENLFEILASYCLLEHANLSFHAIGVPIYARPSKVKENMKLNTEDWYYVPIQGGKEWWTAAHFLKVITQLLESYFSQSTLLSNKENLVEACKECSKRVSDWISHQQKATPSHETASNSLHSP